MTDINVSDLPEFTAVGEVTTSTPTGHLRFVERMLPPVMGDGPHHANVLQQQFATLSYRDGKAYARSFEWRDVPLVMGE